MDNPEYTPEYLEALHKSITTPSTTESGTDTPEIRARRAEKEVFVREHLDAVRGLSFYERILFVRENLFETYVRGDKPSEIRKGSLGLMEGFPEAGAPEAIYPNFVKIVDTLDSFIQDLPKEQQSESSIRLAAIIYGIGIPLHLFKDGNGQTLRLVALSYIHEYSPELKGKYFSQRITTEDPQPIKLKYDNHIIDSVGFLENDPICESNKTLTYIATLTNMFKRQEDKKQVLSLYKSYLETGSCTVDAVQNKWVREIFREAVKMFSVTEADIKLKLDFKS